MKKELRLLFIPVVLIAVCCPSWGNCSRPGDPWGENLRPMITTDFLSSYSDSISRFLGNQTHKDYFKLLQKDGNSLLIGARNVIYNVSLPDLIENRQQRITWNPLELDVDVCLLKGKTTDDCQNYIRVLAGTEDDKLLVCGTNAFKPKCRYYVRSETEYVIEDEFSGVGICPYDPRQNSTALYADGNLYSGTVADFSGSDSLILKNRLRTEQSNLKLLNKPDFVGSMEDEDYVYFFFRESAVEYINCGKTVYSRVARVCKNDKGGPHQFRHGWTTFLKTRLNCSVPGKETPFFFNEIQSITPIDLSLPYEDRAFYGVFTTPENSISGSAVCAFKMSSVRRAFDGQFKDQETSDSKWLPIAKSRTPGKPRPGSCYNASRSLPSSTLNFVKLHSLMSENVNPIGDKPLFVKTSLGERLSVIAADTHVREALDPGKKIDVLYVGTTNGRVLKIANSILIESLQVFPFHVPVRNLMVSGDTLIVLSDHEVASISVQRCDHPVAQSCGDCVALRDPYCAWNVHSSRCVSIEGQDISQLLQNIKSGYHTACPKSSYTQNVTTTTTTVSSTTTTSVTSCPVCNCECSASSMTPKAMEIRTPDFYYSTTENSKQFPTLGPFYDFNEVEAPSEMPRQSLEYGPRFRHSTSSSGDRPVYTEKTLALATVSAAFTALLIGLIGGYLISKKCDKPLKLEFLERRASGNIKASNRRGPGELGLDSGYATPSNLNSTNSTNATGISNNNSKSINLLVNVPPKSETVKQSPIQNTTSSPPPTNTSPSNVGTLQKVKRIYI